MPQGLEVPLPALIHRQPGSATHEVLEPWSIGGQRSPFVERHLIDAHPIAEIGEQADQRLANGTGAHDMNNGLHIPSRCP